MPFRVCNNINHFGHISNREKQSAAANWSFWWRIILKLSNRPAAGVVLRVHSSIKFIELDGIGEGHNRMKCSAANHTNNVFLPFPEVWKKKLTNVNCKQMWPTLNYRIEKKNQRKNTFPQRVAFQFILHNILLVFSGSGHFLLFSGLVWCLVRTIFCVCCVCLCVWVCVGCVSVIVGKTIKEESNPNRKAKMFNNRLKCA